MSDPVVQIGYGVPILGDGPDIDAAVCSIRSIVGETDRSIFMFTGDCCGDLVVVGIVIPETLMTYYTFNGYDNLKVLPDPDQEDIYKLADLCEQYNIPWTDPRWMVSAYLS